VGPYYALLPEIARTTHERVRLSAVMAVFTAVGTLAAGIAVGHWESSAEGPVTLLGVTVDGGLEAFALVTVVLSALSFMLMPLGVKETPRDASKEVPAGLFKGLTIAFLNPAFRAFLGLAVFVQLGLLTFVTGLPYLVTQILERQLEGTGIVAPGQGEAWTGNLQGILFGVALLSLPLVSMAADRWGKNRVMILAGGLFAAGLLGSPLVAAFPDPAVPTIALVILLGFPASCALVLVNAIAADVVDFDERQTGVRREGIYAGASALVAKTAQGLGPAIVVTLTAWFGNSRTDPLGILLVGPVAGLLVLVGILIFRTTPIADEGASGKLIGG
jgi:GPH family glycoside/pentoside/hexuronide:cation symporter